jgi:hypothetical protein
MRAFVLFLALLAALKVWVQDSTYRAAAEEALISAYRTRAAAACEKVAPKSGKPATIQDAMAGRWTEAEPHVSLGNPAIRIHVWELDHELWSARYKQLYLILSGGGNAPSCTYDITADTAEMTSS